MLNSLIYMGFRYNPHLYNHSPLDPRMNIKKLIITVVIALSSSMSVGVAQAQTNFDFSFNLFSGNPASYMALNDSHYLGTLNFEAVVTQTGLMYEATNPTHVVFGKSQPITVGRLNSTSYNYFNTGTFTDVYQVTNLQGNVGSSNSGNYFSFQLNPNHPSTVLNGATHYSFYSDPLGTPPTYPSVGISFTANGADYNLLALMDGFSQISGHGTYGVSASPLFVSIGACEPGCGFGIAPEMNAAFIPQVGLLLACLFFLLGRKKENTEAMLTV